VTELGTLEKRGAVAIGVWSFSTQHSEQAASEACGEFQGSCRLS
jgi:hypothetical protein